MSTQSDVVLGVNGLGRIGKLTIWHHVARKYFKEIVVNTGREVGTSLKDITHYIERDSTYGLLGSYLYGYKAPNEIIKEIDEKSGTMVIDDIKVKVLRSSRNPENIEWQDNDVELVVDTTGQFLDPTIDPDSAKKGCIRGHLIAGASKVIASAPFKIKDKTKEMPKDAVTTIMGINENDYNAKKHKLISNASCTTTCLAHMVKPLINYFGPRKILTASMVTVHASTGSQQVLDRLPSKGKTDLRKNRSISNNIILTSTGAAKTLGLVIPEMNSIGFMAESVRVPTTTGSLVILVLNFQEEGSGDEIRRTLINDIYRKASEQDPNNYLIYSEKQNVSSDIIGLPKAATIIEATETHTRTALATIDLEKSGLPKDVLSLIDEKVIKMPITKAIIYGWYDNELGSYTNLLGDRTVSIAETM